MDIYDHPTFHMACQQFDLVADRLQIPADERARLKFPKRSMTVALPVHMDDGRTEVFTRLPGAASFDARPDQGRLALSSGREAGRGGGAGHVDELEMRADRACLTAAPKAASPAIRETFRKRNWNGSRAVTPRK